MTTGVEYVEYQARPHDELIRELLYPRIPKSEREHAAAREIERLREALKELVNWTPSADTYRRLGFDPSAPMEALKEAKAVHLIAELLDSRVPKTEREPKGVVAWARPVYARPVNAPESAEKWDEMVDVEFHTRPEKPEGEGWYPLIVWSHTMRHKRDDLRGRGANLAQLQAEIEALRAEVERLRNKPHPAIIHCEGCGRDWLDNGLNPVGCPYCKLSEETEALRAEVAEWKARADDLVAALNNCIKLAYNRDQDELPSAIIKTATNAVAKYDTLRCMTRDMNNGDGWKNIGVYSSYDEALKEKEKRFFAVMHASQTEPQSTTDHISGPSAGAIQNFITKTQKPERRYGSMDAAAELRRLHAENERLRAVIKKATRKQALQVRKPLGDEHDKLTQAIFLVVDAVLEEAAQTCEELDEEALCKEGRLASGHECAAAIRALKEVL